MAKSTLTIEEIPLVERGSYILTPEVSRRTNTHGRDILKFIEARAKQLGIHVAIQMNPHPTGLEFVWEPDLDATTPNL